MVRLGVVAIILAFTGVLILAPLLQRRIFGERKPTLVAQLVIETIAAQVLTLPLILWVFGDLSLLAIIANVLVVPLIPLAMAATFLAGMVGVWIPVFFAALASWPATLVLSYITQVVTLLASISWAQISMPISLPLMVGLYVIILLLWWHTKYSFLSRSMFD